MRVYPKDVVNRYLKVKPHGTVAESHFASVSAGCTLLLRDGHYHGCIALAHAAAEAMARFMCERNSFKPEKEFERNVTELEIRGFITPEMKNAFFKIRENRDDYRHLNTQIKTEKQELEKIAIEKVQLLTKIEKEVFDFTIVNGAIKPIHIKYWDGSGD